MSLATDLSPTNPDDVKRDSFVDIHKQVKKHVKQISKEDQHLRSGKNEMVELAKKLAVYWEHDFVREHASQEHTPTTGASPTSAQEAITSSASSSSASADPDDGMKDFDYHEQATKEAQQWTQQLLQCLHKQIAIYQNIDQEFTEILEKVPAYRESRILTTRNSSTPEQQVIASSVSSRSAFADPDEVMKRFNDLEQDTKRVSQTTQEMLQLLHKQVATCQNDDQHITELLEAMLAWRKSLNDSTPEQQAITNLASSSSASAKPPGPTAQNFKKAIMTRLGDPTKIKWNLMRDMRRYEQPLLILVHYHTEFTLLPSTCGFSFSHMEVNCAVYASDDEDCEYASDNEGSEYVSDDEERGYASDDEERGYASDNEGSEYASDDEKIEQDKSDEEEAGQLHSSIPLPYWRIYRENTEYFAAPKDQQGKIRPAGEHNDTVWVDDPSTGDTFLALGWLIAKASCGRKRITRYVCALNLSTDPVSMWLIYDYRQPDFYEYLRLGEVPTIPDENYYLDYPNACDLAGCKHPGDSTGRTEQKKEEKTGFMDQPKPWDIACLYLDADKEWPENLDAIAATAPDADVDYQAPAPLLVYGDAKPNLRAEGAEPPPSLLASFPHSS